MDFYFLFNDAISYATVVTSKERETEWSPFLLRPRDVPDSTDIPEAGYLGSHLS
jgi:hypothetical protein